jgi:hypothetical protein
MVMNYMVTLLLPVMMLINYTASGQTIPETWTPSMKIQASYGGGMLYYSYEIQITDTSGFMMIESDKGIKKYTRAFTKTELNSVLKFLSDHRLQKMKTKFNGLTNDKASESVSLSWDLHYIGASENSSMAVQEEFRQDFSLIQQYLIGLFVKE